MSRSPSGRPRKKQALDPSDVGAAEFALTALLARRELAVAQAREKLLEWGYDPVVVEMVIADFTERQVLDDVRYTERYIASRSGRGQGPVRIRHELMGLGLSAALIEQAFADGPDFCTHCRELRQRKFGTKLPGAWAEKAKQMRFLQYRGFSSDHIKSALGPDPETE